MRHKRDIEALSAEARKKLDEKYGPVLAHPMWTFARDTRRIVRPYSTSDFTREYFIPNI